MSSPCPRGVSGSHQPQRVYDYRVAQQVIPTDRNGAHVSAEQLADAGVRPGEPAIVEVRPYTKADFERDDGDRTYETVETFAASLEDYCRLPDPQ
jgi:hypothetical protein